MSQAKYRYAGTVEFLVDTATDEIYFIEVNPRIQVKHTVAEEVCGVDLVQLQTRIAAADLGLSQEQIDCRGVRCNVASPWRIPSVIFCPIQEH
jgi:biotin carboxylase